MYGTRPVSFAAKRAEDARHPDKSLRNASRREVGSHNLPGIVDPTRTGALERDLEGGEHAPLKHESVPINAADDLTAIVDSIHKSPIRAATGRSIQMGEDAALEDEALSVGHAVVCPNDLAAVIDSGWDRVMSVRKWYI